MLNNYTLLGVAITSNIAAVYFMKWSAGMTLAWPTLAMVMANLITLWFLGRAFAEGISVGPAVTVLTVGVMIGSFVIGLFFGERITALQAFGALVAIAGVVLANLKMGQAT
jgi:small multidrug resistance pump